MKVASFFFSLTGNTKKIARAISLGIERAGHAVEETLISEAGDRAVGDADVVGLGTPVHAWGLPLHLEDDLKRLPPLRDKPVFIFITYGHDPGNAMAHLWDAVTRRGGRILATFQQVCSDNHYHLRRYRINEGRPDEGDLARAEEFGLEIPGMVGALKSGDLRPVRPRVDPNLLELSRRMSTGWANRELMAKKRYHPELCERCGQCEEICPVGAAYFEPMPGCGPGCTGCTGCAMICPSGAIDIPSNTAFEFWMRTVLRGHYSPDLWKRGPGDE